VERIALVACVKEKLNHPASAEVMYLGASFNEWMNDAKKRDLDHIYILSGKYGLLELGEIIEPYDLNLGLQDEKYINAWKWNVLAKLRQRHNLSNTHATVYTNKVYHEGLIEFFNSYEIPFQID
jgi:cytoplasmic iron level regulating protein YaaA (DUF328/UPF0246 family)